METLLAKELSNWKYCVSKTSVASAQGRLYIWELFIWKKTTYASHLPHAVVWDIIQWHIIDKPTLTFYLKTWHFHNKIKQNFGEKRLITKELPDRYKPNPIEKRDDIFDNQISRLKKLGLL